MLRFSICFLFMVFPFLGINQVSMKTNIKDRQPAVAGSFYPADATELKKIVNGFLASAKPDQTKGQTRAIVVPHAGYVFSGGVAASGYNQVNADQTYKTVFIIASSHRFSFGKASVYCQGDYISPLGRIPVDTDICNQLISQSGAFIDYPEAHIPEHSIEVQLPFLQCHLKHPFKIVPIIIGTQKLSVCEDIAKALKPYFTKENLFVISSDFSHYPAYEQAVTVDATTAKAFCSNSIESFISTIHQDDQRVPGLATRMCAWPSGLVLLYLTKGSNLEFNKIDYKNSGDIEAYGDKSSVVGYHAICISEPQVSGFTLTETDKKALLDIARRTVESYVKTRTRPTIDASTFSQNLTAKAGAFVTLKIGETLRGCIGSFQPDIPLYQVVQEMTIASSTQDSRFQPVQSSELSAIHIEISVLTPMKKIRDTSEIQLGKHGIYLKKGYSGGTFLPQVATETGWNLEEFLGHCARDKAGIGWFGWKDADIYTYEALVFEEDIPKKK